MRTNYERTKVVLDKLNAIAVKAGLKKIDQKVTDRLKELSAEFGGLWRVNRAPIDYTSPITQIAYAYRCLTAHADLLHRSLAGARKHVHKALGTDEIKIACIGGGPGADALGVVKFLERFGPTDRPVVFAFVDRESAWKAVRNVLFPTFDQIDCARKVVQADLANGPPWVESWWFATADIFTFNFSLSEVWSFDKKNGSVTSFLNELIKKAKKGALFVYADNSSPSFLPHAERVFSKHPDLEEIYSDDDDWMLIGSDEQQSVIQEYVDRYKEPTKKTGKVNRRIWRKK